MYSRASVGMVIHKYTHNMDWQVGNFALTKIFEVMYWGMPVVATDYSLWQEQVFDKYHCAIPVNPTDVKQIRTAIKELLDHPENSIAMGQKGKKAVKESFNWYSQEKKLIELYENLTISKK